MNEMPEKLLRGIKNGSDEDFEALARMYAPLLSSMAASFQATGAGSQDELLQEARSALLKAALRYNGEQQNVSFGLYAKICIRNALISMRRKVLARMRRETRQPVRQKSKRVEYRVPENILEAGRLMEQIDRVLSVYERRVLTEYMTGKTAEQIAASLGRNKKSVNNALFRIRTKIKALDTGAPAHK